MKISVFECIFLILSLSLIVVYVYAQIYPKDPRETYKHTKRRIAYSELLKTAQNGDLVLLSGNTPGEKTCKFCTGSEFSHVGMLFRETHPETKEDVLYIFDCDLGQGTKDGVRVMPLEEKLRKYKGFKIGGYRRLIGLEKPSTHEIIKLIGEMSHIDMDESIVTWWVANYPLLHARMKDENKMFCSEFVAEVYKKLNIMKDSRLSAWYSPKNFHVSQPDLQEGYTLGECLYFDFPK